MKQFTSIITLLVVSSRTSSVVDGFRPSVHPNDVTLVKNLVGLPPPVVPRSIDLDAKPVMHKVLKPVTTLRKKWGVDNEHPNEYWFDDRIHVFGNHGFWGAVHAAVAPLSTHLIDVAAYNGEDIRQRLATQLSERVHTKKARVVDLCCGTGFSTRALLHAFPDAEAVIGIDTSAEMIAMANFLTSHLATVKPFFNTAVAQISEQYQDTKAEFKAVGFAQSNAEDTNLPSKSFDLVTVMWAFHEAPHQGRERIIQEARRLLSPGGTLAVIDISTDYVPSEEMLKGEPYVQEYQQNIHKQLQTSKGFHRADYQTIVPNHLGMWTLTRSAVA